MRIALITTGIPPHVTGGMQSHSWNLARSLARLGAEVDLYHTFRASERPEEQLVGFDEKEREGIHSIMLPWPCGNSLPGHYLRENNRLSAQFTERLLQRPSVDFIYVQGFLGQSLLRARRTGKISAPIGINLHGLEMFQRPPSLKAIPGQMLMRWKARAELRAADLVFSFGGKSLELTRKAVGVLDTPIAVVPNGVDASWVVDQAKVRAEGPRRFLFIGRYERRKAVPEINAALRKLAGQQHWQFSFVGPIPVEKQILEENVVYHGLVRDRQQLMAILDDADVLVCPSYSEGMPTVILEAMARGLAVIATDVGAVRTMVSSENGLLLPEVSVVGICRVMGEFIGLSPETLKSKKQCSLEKVRQFTWEKVASLTLEAMEQSIKHP